MPRLLDYRHLVRRTRLYARRSLRSATGRGLTHPVLFLHLPKCGGTSLAAALYGAVPLHQRIGVIDAVATRRVAALIHFGQDDPVLCHEDLPNGHLTFDLREGQMLTHMAWRSRLIHGHVLWSDRAMAAFGDQWRVVTMMREPVTRAISNYRMAVRAGVIEDDLDVWLAGPVGKSMAEVYLRYLSGVNVVLPEAQPQHLERALRALDQVALVGFIDDQAAFSDRFAALFGPSLSLPHYNAATGPDLSLTRVQRARLEANCAADLEIFAAAEKRFR
ncbi:hypothetical protein [Halovulum sp. GXIMD14793]